jgi:uncharacterized membrane protein required for colicin V production
MLLTNLILIVAILGFIGSGMKDGFVHSFGRLVGAIIGFVAARAWSIKAASVLGLFMSSGTARFISFIIIFIIITHLVGYAFKLVDGAFRVLSIIPFLTSINNLLGGILGFIEGLILLGGAIYLVTTFSLIPWLATRLSGSFVAAWILKTFHILLGVLL